MDVPTASILLAVFDCPVYLQAVLRDRGPAFACFRLVDAGEILLITSEAILTEVRAAYLVTRDRDLLDLQRPQSLPGQKLRVLAPQLAILDPVQFLQQVVPRPADGESSS